MQIAGLHAHEVVYLGSFRVSKHTSGERDAIC